MFEPVTITLSFSRSLLTELDAFVVALVCAVAVFGFGAGASARASAEIRNADAQTRPTNLFRRLNFMARTSCKLGRLPDETILLQADFASAEL
jgi:hypothetical protein